MFLVVRSTAAAPAAVVVVVLAPQVESVALPGALHDPNRLSHRRVAHTLAVAADADAAAVLVGAVRDTSPTGYGPDAERTSRAAAVVDDVGLDERLHHALLRGRFPAALH